MVGANYEELEAGAARMQRAADDLDSHARSIQGTIGNLSWIGTVATAFVSMWNGGHRRKLANTATFIRNASLELERQARQQRYAAEHGSEAWLSDIIGDLFGGTPDQAPPEQPGDAAGAAPGSAQPNPPGGLSPQPPLVASTGVGASTGALRNSNRTWQEAQAAYDARYASNEFNLFADAHPGAANSYQCVSWAWFRLRELGYTGEQFSADGGQVAAGFGGTTDTTPALGAVVSSSSGHVMIVEELTQLPDGRLSMRVSEMNTMRHADGTRAPDYDAKGNFIRASADEFRADRWITQAADGKWNYYPNDVRTLTIANPSYS